MTRIILLIILGAGTTSLIPLLQTIISEKENQRTSSKSEAFECGFERIK
jgi:hypothetical protein